MPSSIYGPNLALELLNAYAGVDRKLHQEIDAKVDELSKLNEINQHLQTLLNAFTQAKSAGKADFTHDTDFQYAKEKLQELDPEISHRLFGHGPDVWKSKEAIEGMIQSCDAEVKMQVTRVNGVTMNISQLHEDCAQFTESASKTLELLMRHIESILSKLRQH